MATLSKQAPVTRLTYPWAEWLDGKARDLKQGVDFPTTVTNVKATAYQAAKRLGLKVIVNILNNDTVRIQAIVPAKAKKRKK